MDHLYSLDSVDSTNNCLKNLAMQGAPQGTVVIAKQQTNGKGRLGRSFQSPEAMGLYYSYLFRNIPDDQLLSLTPLCGVATCKALERWISEPVSLKWPNDLILHKKKIGGILLEALTVKGHIDAIIAGIGINLLQKSEDFEGDVQKMASSVLQETGISIVREELATILSMELDALENNEQNYTYYKRRCITLGQPIRILSENQTAIAVDLDKDFGLIVQLDDGSQKTLHVGEVSVRGLYGYAE